jgi:hypothetical protein
VLFIITLIVNAMSRALIWRMNRQPKPKKVPVAATAEVAA